MGQELLCMFCPVDNECVTNKPEPDPWHTIGEELKALVLKSSMKRLATTWLRGDPMAAPFTCL